MAKAGGSASGQEPSEKWIQASTSFNSSSSNNSSSSSSRNSGGGVGGTSSGASASSGSGSNSHQGQETNSGSGGGVNSDNISFECNICLDTAKDAVVSMCGHLFCWPCLHQWLETKPNRQVCPVCKAAISRDQVIPLYGRGSSRQDPRDKLPPRPPGQRSEPPDSSSSFNSANFPGFGDGGFHMSFGIGAFPFGFFTSSFNFNETRPFPNLTLENQEDMTFNRIFLWVALIFIAWLLLA